MEGRVFVRRIAFSADDLSLEKVECSSAISFAPITISCSAADDEREGLRAVEELAAAGLSEGRRGGQKLGRPAGTTLAPTEFLRKHKVIVRLLKSGQSVRNAAAIAPANPR